MFEFVLSILLFGFFIIVMYWISEKYDDGCSGDCNQGRWPCNCKKDYFK